MNLHEPTAGADDSGVEQWFVVAEVRAVHALGRRRSIAAGRQRRRYWARRRQLAHQVARWPRAGATGTCAGIADRRVAEALARTRGAEARAACGGGASRGAWRAASAHASALDARSPAALAGRRALRAVAYSTGAGIDRRGIEDLRRRAAFRLLRHRVSCDAAAARGAACVAAPLCGGGRDSLRLSWAVV